MRANASGSGQHLSRRAMLTLGSLGLESCSAQGQYFGKTIPPRSQTLIYEISAMPVLPLCFDVYTFVQKPYVRGRLGNSIDTPRFSDVSIDTNWRPS